MKTFFRIAAAALLAVAGSAFAATTAGSPSINGMPAPNAGSDFGNPPPADVIVTHAGMQWIWAGPCSMGPGSCGPSTPMHGFDNPTASDWATWADLATFAAAFTNGSGGALCGAPWMNSVHSHCDYSDMSNGHIWNAPGLCDPGYYDGCSAGTTETFFIRAVPEPQTYALMIAGLGLVGVLARRRRPHES